MIAGGAGILPVAAEAPVSSVVQKEIARRNARTQEASALMNEGALLYGKGEYAQAASDYRQAWELLPDSPITAPLRQAAKEGYSRAAVEQAKKLAAVARYEEARSLLESVLAEDFDPGNKQAIFLRKSLDDPDRYEAALTPQHLENVAKVEHELRLASGFMSLGDYNSAIAHYQDLLRIDPYNSAARRGMERTEQLKSEYYDAARDHTRAKRLAEVNQGWEDAIPRPDIAALFGGLSGGLGAIGGAKENILTKLRTLIVPVVDLQGASLDEVVEFLRIRSRDLDPEKRGVDFVLKVSRDTALRPITLSMVGVPLEEVLRYATEITGTVYRVDEFAVTITSRAEKSDTLILKSWRVPPGFLENAPAAAPAANTPPPDPFAKPGAATATTGFGSLEIHRLGPKEFLEQRGVVFPEGATASYVPASNILTVRNTAENLAMVDTLVEDASTSAPKQVQIEVKMMEVNETRLQELGFDWMLSPFNTPGSNGVFASGGTVGSGTDFSSEVIYPTVGANPITSGLRSTGDILGRPSIDGLLVGARPPRLDSRSPGAFTVAGVFTDPQFQVVLRTLSQSKGVDLMASPTVVTKAGQRATINIVREFIYPTEYDPPQIPQNTNNGTLTTLVGGIVTSVTQNPYTLPTTPSTPTAFAKRDVGINLEAEAVVGENNRTVDLNLVPSSTEFEGFIDYGQDFTSFSVGRVPLPGIFGFGNTVDFFPVDNPVLQPIFRTNKVTTSVTIWDGNTVVLGGVMYEKTQNINDKVPIIGNLPIVGRAFQSQVAHKERKNVIFFVTVHVIDPGGNPVNHTAPSGPVTAGQ